MPAYPLPRELHLKLERADGDLALTRDVAREAIDAYEGLTSSFGDVIAAIALEPCGGDILDTLEKGLARRQDVP